MSTRNRVIDITKGLGICLVVMGHLTNQGEWQRIFIHSFHMPLFMILSGYCFKIDKISNILQKSIKKYLLIAYATIFIDILLNMLLKYRFTFPSKKAWVSTFILHGGLWINIPIWFLFTLVLCQVLVTLLLKHSKAILILFTIFLVVSNEIFQYSIHWWVTSTLYAFPFFTVGFVSKIYEKKILQLINSRKSWTNYILMISFVVAIYWNGYTDMYSLVKGKSYLIFMYTGIIGTLFMLKLASSIKDYWGQQKISFLGTKTFIILITHYYICRKLIPILLNYLNLNGWSENIVFQIILTIIIMCGYYVILIPKKKKLIYIA